MVMVITILLVLLVLNALFVAAEFAAIGARESRIRAAAEEGNRSARLLLPYVADVRRLDRYISSCQLGITTTSLGLGAYSEQALAVRIEPLLGSVVGAHSISVILVLIVMTALQVTLAEQVPKSVALHRPNRVAMWTVWPVVACQWLLHYVISFLNASAQGVLWLMRAPAAVHRHVHSREEIDLIIGQSRERGQIEAEQHDRLQHVLELETVTARQLMVPRREIAALDYDANAENGVQLIIEGRHTRQPVFRNTIDEVVGVIHTKDLARNAVEQGSIKDWRKLIRPMYFVNEGMTADRLLETMREKKTMQAMVMDEFGGVAGLVTLEDVLTHVFGEVGDEFSADSQPADVLPDGRIRLPGRMRLDDARDVVGVPWLGMSTTVGGFVTEHLGQLPEAGLKIEIDGVDLLVEGIENHVVTSVVVTPAQDETELPGEAPDAEASGQNGEESR